VFDYIEMFYDALRRYQEHSAIPGTDFPGL
jgi:hypothetical protein